MANRLSLFDSGVAGLRSQTRNFLTQGVDNPLMRLLAGTPLLQLFWVERCAEGNADGYAPRPLGARR